MRDISLSGHETRTEKCMQETGLLCNTQLFQRCRYNIRIQYAYVCMHDVTSD